MITCELSKPSSHFTKLLGLSVYLLVSVYRCSMPSIMSQSSWVLQHSSSFRESLIIIQTDKSLHEWTSFSPAAVVSVLVRGGNELCRAISWLWEVFCSSYICHYLWTLINLPIWKKRKRKYIKAQYREAIFKFFKEINLIAKRNHK